MCICVCIDLYVDKNKKMQAGLSYTGDFAAAWATMRPYFK